MIGYHDDGRRKYRSFYGKTQAEAKAKAKIYQDSKAKGVNVDADCWFEDWADKWFDIHSARISPATKDSYSYTLRILKSSFRQKKISAIKPIDIELMLQKLHDEGRSKSSITKCRGMMYQVLKSAVANDIVAKNAAEYIGTLKFREPMKRKDVFTADEVSLMMKHLPENRIGISIRLLLGTGMRPQEVLALEPRHITLDGSSISIEQAVTMEKGKVTIGPPKSPDSYRLIPVPECLRWCAIALRQTEKKFIWEAGKEGSPCNPSHFRNQFRRALEAIPEVKTLTPHSCRHTYVTQLQALGVDLATIKSLVGHADVGMTEHYLHVQDSIRHEAVTKLDAAFRIN